MKLIIGIIIFYTKNKTLLSGRKCNNMQSEFISETFEMMLVNRLLNRLLLTTCSQSDKAGGGAKQTTDTTSRRHS